MPDPAATRAALQAAAGAPHFAGRLHDLRFDRDGELTGRDEVLRVRREVGRDGGSREILGWKGPTTRSPDGYKARPELERGLLPDQPPTAPLLEALGYRVVHAIDRYVECWTAEAAMLRLEWYPDGDTLLEVEGDPTAIERAIPLTGLPRAAFTADPLVRFGERFAARTGRAPRFTLLPGETPVHWPR